MLCESICTDMECNLSRGAASHFKKDNVEQSSADFCDWHVKHAVGEWVSGHGMGPTFRYKNGKMHHWYRRIMAIVHIDGVFWQNTLIVMMDNLLNEAKHIYPTGQTLTQYEKFVDYFRRNYLGQIRDDLSIKQPRFAIKSWSATLTNKRSERQTAYTEATDNGFSLPHLKKVIPFI